MVLRTHIWHFIVLVDKHRAHILPSNYLQERITHQPSAKLMYTLICNINLLDVTLFLISQNLGEWIFLG